MTELTVIFTQTRSEHLPLACHAIPGTSLCLLRSSSCWMLCLTPFTGAVAVYLWKGSCMARRGRIPQLLVHHLPSPQGLIWWGEGRVALAPETWERLMWGFSFPKGMREEVVWGEERCTLTVTGKPSPCPLKANPHPQHPSNMCFPISPHAPPSLLPATEVNLSAQL